MPVRRKDEGDVVQLTKTVAFALLQAVLRRQAFVFGFQNRERDGLASGCKRATENVSRNDFMTTTPNTTGGVEPRNGTVGRYQQKSGRPKDHTGAAEKIAVSRVPRQSVT